MKEAGKAQRLVCYSLLIIVYTKKLNYNNQNNFDVKKIKEGLNLFIYPERGVKNVRHLGMANNEKIINH
jgi:3-dehydroquinate synthase class II